MRSLLLVGLLATTLAGTVAAAPTAVSAVNMPAWLERTGEMRPLAPGIRLQSGDVLHTGRGARVLLTLPEGSQLKLGEEAVFRVDNLNVSDGKKTPFVAAVHVLQGAFRFTTGLLDKVRQREVDIRVATVTAGIRGTDLWGKADAEKDLVCLLEGRVSVEHEGESGFTNLDQPLDFYVAPKGKPALPVAKVDADKVARDWAPQTEPQAGKGLASAAGRWRLVLALPDNQDEALRWYDTLREAGYAAKIRPLTQGRFRVGLEQLASEADARTLGERLKAELQTPLSTTMRMGE
ncbi:hypothetical protein FNU76_10850 [Chitinimonas arctica]|uniref:SPOR domain-containing protein n=1 Tax=Chitinimonas arctica TaxID=2594795 RepID=A0A516SF85_9NEIS|nr:FecR domain-containing protein [Chitinimonas arctica]QDQ26824.1 hypothetical protein FNU76_10850 [Chitinimonas arctica]